jgi:ABC-type uncharacterized transport system permease subunit
MSQVTKNSKRTGLLSQRTVNAILRYLLMLLLALAVFGVILLLSGKNPIQAYGDILRSTLGSSYGFSEVLVAMVPMVITALAVALPSRVGLINVGVEGQLYAGAGLATWGALTFSTLPSWALLPLMVLLGMLGGAAWAFIPGYLKATGLVNETITSIPSPPRLWRSSSSASGTGPWTPTRPLVLFRQLACRPFSARASI